MAVAAIGPKLDPNLTVPSQKRKASQRISRYEASHLTNRPGRNRTCNPRFWSAPLATPALKRLLIFKDLALGDQRRRRWTTPALALILALGGAARCIPCRNISPLRLRRSVRIKQPPLQP